MKTKPHLPKFSVAANVARNTLLPLLLLVLILVGFRANAQVSPEEYYPDNVTATIHVDQTGVPIHPYVYGMFTELLHNMFENGLWAEILSDRKFFYPIDNSQELVPRNRKRHQNRWRPVGPEASVTMDSSHVWVGKHSPRVLLDGTTPQGIKQAGMWLRTGSRYDGRVILCGDPGITVEVSLVWGEGPNDRQTITIQPLTEQYIKYPLNFTAGGDTDDGRIEITGTGAGSFNIGAVSLMPTDNNINGWRKDMIEILKTINSGIYRWPGGNFVANYEWRHGIGDIDTRPSRYDYAWSTVESNDVGSDEFAVFCQLCGVDPYYVVNIGFGDQHSAAQWVEYMNGDRNTPMGQLRAMNGHPEPYDVEWWGIGNEMYGVWQLGRMSSKHYVWKHNLFAEAMLEVDPTIKIIASGATIFERSTTHRLERPPLRKLPLEYMSEDDWTGMLFQGALENIDFMAEHIYPVYGSYFDYESQEWIEEDNDSLDYNIRRLTDRVKGMVESYEKYLELMPEIKSKNITFAIDEWLARGRGFGRTLSAAEGLHEMMRHSEYITMGAYTGISGLYSSNDVGATISSTGLLFRLYNEQLGTIPVEISGNSPQPEIKGTVGVDKAAEMSGSDTYPLDMFATLSEDKTVLTVAIANPTHFDQEITIDYQGASVSNRVTVYQIKPPNSTARNSPDQPDVIQVEESQVNMTPKVKVPPLSITLYQMDLR